MQKIVLLALLYCLLPLAVLAQGNRFFRYSCLPQADEQPGGDAAPSAMARARHLPSLRTDWDATRTYPVAVVLVSFADRNFSMADPRTTYDRMFNEPGYNEGRGPGCVADYFRDQSGGLFQPRFDVYGPVQVVNEVNGNGAYGGNTFSSALQRLADSLSIDMTPYDWDGDGQAEYVVYIYAGYGGNETANEGKGYIWPNTGSHSALTIGGVCFSGYSASAELWSNGRLCGIGTVCHEYSHTLGLPDIYPASGNEYAVCDEWDLMDGGNFTNNGWCPCNYSAHERMLLGWLTPVELTEAATISGLKPLSEGGTAYLVSHTGSEFLLLENRQWTGWDMLVPGHGLMVAHVDYNAVIWAGNRVNNLPTHHRYDYVHADNLDYNDWDSIMAGQSRYVNGRSRLLCGTPYPLIEDGVTVNSELTDTSVPAALMFNANADGQQLLSKPITAITETADGLVSFLFMGGTSAIQAPHTTSFDYAHYDVYDLQGRRINPAALHPSPSTLYLLRDKHGNTRLSANIPRPVR